MELFGHLLGFVGFVAILCQSYSVIQIRSSTLASLLVLMFDSLLSSATDFIFAYLFSGSGCAFQQAQQNVTKPQNSPALAGAQYQSWKNAIANCSVKLRRKFAGQPLGWGSGAFFFGGFSCRSFKGQHD